MYNQNQSQQNGAQVSKKLKPLVAIEIEATVKELPQLKKMKQDDGSFEELYRTYVELKTSYRPFSTDIYTKNKPTVCIGDIIRVNLTTTDYKLRMAKAETE